MCNITKNSINEDRKILGTFYVLSALTLVSEDALILCLVISICFLNIF